MAGVVIDKKMLKVFAAKIGALVSTSIPVALAISVTLRQQTSDSNDSCELNNWQNELLTQSMKLLRQTAAFNVSATGHCSYNRK